MGLFSSFRDQILASSLGGDLIGSMVLPYICTIAGELSGDRKTGTLPKLTTL